MPLTTPSLTIADSLSPSAAIRISRESQRCRECKRLESNVEYAIQSVSLTIRTKFPKLSDKLRVLHQWQDARDNAMETLYEHKKCHSFLKTA